MTEHEQALISEALALHNSQKGMLVRRFEEAFARFVGARHAIAHANGTCTMHTALVVLGVQPGDPVAVPPLTYGSTTFAVLHAGAIPLYVDVNRDDWLMGAVETAWQMPVSLYGMQAAPGGTFRACVNDAAETLNAHAGDDFAFTSYSFEASKILPIGEGGMLVTNDEELATVARSFSIVGTPFAPQSRSPQQVRHVRIGANYQMSDVQAAVGLARLEHVSDLIAARQYAADCLRQAVAGCDWIIPQHVPVGCAYTPWCCGMALRAPEMWEPFAQAVEAAGGERPYAAFRLSYQEPGLRHLALDGTCPVAEDLQPRLVQLQTNHDKVGAERAAECLKKAIASCGF